MAAEPAGRKRHELAPELVVPSHFNLSKGESGTMSQVLLDQRFWQEQFLVPAEAVEAIHSHLGASGVASTRELAEITVRIVLEGQVGTRGFRVYSPEQAYERGEGIFIHWDSGHKFAHVLSVDRSRDQSGQFSYRKMIVRFKGEVDTHILVTDCPNFPARFSGHIVIAGREAFTPGAIAMKFYDSIAPALEGTLHDDGRFLSFNDTWMLEDHFLLLDEPLLSRVAHLLREHGHLGSTEIAERLYPGRTMGSKLNTTALSVAVGLENDKAKRFVSVVGLEGSSWILSPPPKEVVITLKEDCVEGGFLPLSEALLRVLFYYGLDQDSFVSFTVYGDYKIRGSLDTELGRVNGKEIHQWIAENILQPGSRIYVKSPDPRSTDLRLYTLQEIQGYTPSPQGDREPEGRNRKYLRHLIYPVLLQRNQYLHYKEIADLVAQAGTPVDPSSVVAILSDNSHLFSRRQPSRGLWGLKSWDLSESGPDVSPTSLLLAIEEESWVRRILEEEGRPLAGREIAKRLADLFQVRAEQVRELSFISSEDGHLQLLADGRWALRTWVPKWSHQIAEIEEELRRASLLHKQIAELEGKINAARHRLENTHSVLAALGTQLSEEDRQLKESAKRIMVCRRKLDSHKHYITSLEQQMQSLDSLSAKLRWSTVFLLGLFVLLATAGLTLGSLVVTATGAGTGLLLLILRRYAAGVKTGRGRLLDQLEGMRSSTAAVEKELTDHVNRQTKGEGFRETLRAEIERVESELKSTAADLARLSQNLESQKRESTLSNEPDLLTRRDELGKLLELAGR